MGCGRVAQHILPEHPREAAGAAGAAAEPWARPAPHPLPGGRTRCTAPVRHRLRASGGPVGPAGSGWRLMAGRLLPKPDPWNTSSITCYGGHMAAYLPPGWPAGVHPPGSQDFERTAVAWLLDVVPPDYRLYGVLRRHPIALAALARHHLAACVEGARRGYRTARTELGDVLPVHGLDAVLAAYRSEGRRLVATACAVDLVARALRGEVFTPQLRDAPGQQGQSLDQQERQDKAPAPGRQRAR